jgi:hypothetical protein
MEDHTVVLMGYAINSLLKNSKLSDVKPKDLMDGLIKLGFFNKDHRNGLPLRNILRDLDERQKLYLLPQLTVERKEQNRFWYFNFIDFKS